MDFVATAPDIGPPITYYLYVNNVDWHLENWKIVCQAVKHRIDSYLVGTIVNNRCET